MLIVIEATLPFVSNIQDSSLEQAFCWRADMLHQVQL